MGPVVVAPGGFQNHFPGFAVDSRPSVQGPVHGPSGNIADVSDFLECYRHKLCR